MVFQNYVFDWNVSDVGRFFGNFGYVGYIDNVVDQGVCNQKKGYCLLECYFLVYLFVVNQCVYVYCYCVLFFFIGFVSLIR